MWDSGYGNQPNSSNQQSTDRQPVLLNSNSYQQSSAQQSSWPDSFHSSFLIPQMNPSSLSSSSRTQPSAVQNQYTPTSIGYDGSQANLGHPSSSRSHHQQMHPARQDQFKDHQSYSRNPHDQYYSTSSERPQRSQPSVVLIESSAKSSNEHSASATSGSKAKSTDSYRLRCNYCDKNGHVEEYCRLKNKEAMNDYRRRRDAKCTYCYKMGHLEEECLIKQRHSKFCDHCKIRGHSFEECRTRLMEKRSTAPPNESSSGLSGETTSKESGASRNTPKNSPRPNPISPDIASSLESAKKGQENPIFVPSSPAARFSSPSIITPVRQVFITPPAAFQKSTTSSNVSVKQEPKSSPTLRESEMASSHIRWENTPDSANIGRTLDHELVSSSGKSQ